MHQHTTQHPGSAAQRLRRLKTLVAQRTSTEWGEKEIGHELAQDPDSPDATCPRFAGIIDESGEEALIIADTEEELAFDMAGRLTSEIPIRPIELGDLDTQQHRLAFCEATVRFAPVPVDHPGADHETRSERKAMTSTPEKTQPSDQNDTATQVTRALRDPDRTDHDDHEITFVWSLGEDSDGGTRQAVVRINHHKHARGGAFSATLLNQTERKTPSVTEQCMGAITEWTRIADEPVARYSNTQLERFADGALERVRSLYGQDSHEGRRVRDHFQVKS